MFYSDEEENQGNNEDNEVIDEDSGDIYYNRDIDEEQKYMDNFGEYSENTSSSKSRDFLPYGGNTQDKQDEYNLAGLQSAGMQLENPTSSSEADVIAQQDAINQMIYGDLGADTEMLDLDINNAAIGFELHSNQTFSGMQQNAFELESSSQTFDPVGTEDLAVMKQSNVEEVQIQEEIQTQADLQSEPDQNVDKPSTSKMEETKPATDIADPKESPIEEQVTIEPARETTNPLEKPTQATEMEFSEPVDDQITSVVSAPTEEAVSIQTVVKANSDPIKFDKASTKSRSRNNSSSTDEPKTPARRTRRTASQDTTNEIENSADVDVPKTRLRKASSQQSLSSQGDGSAEITNPLRRTTRSASQKSLNEDIEVTSIERTRRGTSQQKELLETISEPKTPKTSKISSRRASKQDSNQTEQKETETEVSQEPEQKTLKRKNTKDESEATVDLGDTFNAEESVSSRRLRKAVSHATLNDIMEEEDIHQSPLPKRKRAKDSSSESAKPPRRAASHQSLSSISETNSTDENPIEKRSSRAGSVTKSETRPRRAASQNALNTIINESLPKQRRKRAQSEAPEIETDLGDRFNAEESVSSRRLRKAVSHQTLSNIDEIDQTPTKPKGRSKKNSESEDKPPRRAASHQSLSSLSEKELESPTTRSRAKKVLAVDKQESEPKTPSRRTRRTASEKESPNEIVDEKKTTKIRRGVKKDDDTNSEASSIVSTRGRKTPAIDNEDDNTSVKSTKTKKVTRTGLTLPAIVEDDNIEPGTSTSDYLESSRLTRSQRSAIEKYAKNKVDTDPSTMQRTSSRKVKTEKEEDIELVESDTESLKSQTSKLSKKSEASSQRTTRSLRSKK